MKTEDLLRKVRRSHYTISASKLQRFIVSKHYAQHNGEFSEFEANENDPFPEHEDDEKENQVPQTEIMKGIKRARPEEQQNDHAQDADAGDDVLMNPALITDLTIEPPAKK